MQQFGLYLRTIMSLALLTMLASCGAISYMEKVQEEKRNQYQASQPLPDLEVPPDLLLESSELSLNVPRERQGDPQGRLPQPQGNKDKGASPDLGVAGLPEPQERKDLDLVAKAVPTSVAVGHAAVVDGKILEVGASTEQLWPLLKQYFESKGRSLNVEDSSLGVIETSWSVPYLQQGTMLRDRVSVLVEPGSSNSITKLAFSSDLQTFSKGGEGGGDWELTGRAEELESGMRKELEQFITERI